MTWQPIETAPKDGSIILLFRPAPHPWGRVDIARWDTNKYATRPKPFWRSLISIVSKTEMRHWAPTHWQLLPEPPAQDENTSGDANG